MESRGRWLELTAAAIAAPVLLFTESAKRGAAQTPPAATAIIQPTVDATPFYYAVHADLFERAGLALTTKSLASGNLAIESIVAGVGQIGLSNTLSIAQAHARGIPLQVLFGAGFHAPNAPIVWLFAGADSTIHAAIDLVGATIAVSGLHDLLALSTRAWLAQQGVDSTKVHFVELPQAQMLAALQQKRVDAICSFEPFASAIAASGSARVLATPYDAIAKSFNVTVWFTYGPWLATGRPAAQRFVSAMREAGTYANAHLPEMIPIVAAATGISTENVQHALGAKTALEVVPALVQPVIDAAAKFGELTASFPARELLPNPPL